MAQVDSEPKSGYEYIDELVLLPGNAKEHDIGAIGGSIGEFGYIERVVKNVETGHIISGNGRVETLLDLYRRVRRGEVGVVVPDGVDVVEGGRWRVLVDYERVAAEKEQAAAIALNRAGELGGWDEGRLFERLEGLVEELGERGLAGTGFDAEDMQVLGEKLGIFGGNGAGGGVEEEGEEGEESDADKILSEAIERWGCAVNDIWVIGRSVVGCGDCRDEGFVGKVVEVAGVRQVNGVITSPPYANQRQEDYGGIREDEYVDWWELVQANMAEILAVDGSFFVNIKPHTKDGVRATYVFDLVLAMVRRWGWSFIDEFCWERVGVPGDWPNRFKNGFEPVYHFAAQPQIKFFPDNVTHESVGSAGATQNRNVGKYYNTLDGFDWQEARPSNRIPYGGKLGGYGHPAMFPFEMPQFFIKAFSQYGDAWIDPFCGVGSTLVACVREGRTGIGVEIDPRYVAVSLDRLVQETGQAPHRM